jgi:hypothetical protein
VVKRKSDSQKIVGKEVLVSALTRAGFQSDEATRAYEILSARIGEALLSGETVHFRKVCKLIARTLPPRPYHDNLNNRMIYFGERVVYRLKVLITPVRKFVNEKLPPPPDPGKASESDSVLRIDAGNESQRDNVQRPSKVE